MSFRNTAVLFSALFAAACAPQMTAAPPPFAAPMPPNAAPPPPSALAAPQAPDAQADADASKADDEQADTERADDIDEESSDEAPMAKIKSPALDMDDASFAHALKGERASLGPMSIGRPHNGILVNGVQMPTGAQWRLVDPPRAYGTQESVDAIMLAIKRVNDKFPNTPVIDIGHLSAEHGGHLSPHKSHQSGVDVDIGYYYSVQSGWFRTATANNLDRARTWALMKAFAQDENIEFILVDTSIQKLLREYALAQGEDHDFVDKMIQYGSKQPHTVLRHIKGHATHLHVRFLSPVARQVGARAEPFFHGELVRAAAPPPPPSKKGPAAQQAKTDAGRDSKKTAEPGFVEHRVHDGDTLYRLAQHYGVSVDAIRKANGLKGVALKPKMVLKIPTKS